LSPEGFASILYKDSSKCKEAAENMKITAKDLKKLGIIDKIIEEPQGGAQNDLELVSNSIKQYLLKSLKELNKLSEEELIENRYQRFRKMGN
jgi:acetyl-CoA carboxylase carboxyl transferase subunit alpha